MPDFDVNDPDTWEHATLLTPEGPIDYWVLPMWNEYQEQATENNSATQILIAVPWADAQLFKWYALGHVSLNCDSQTFLRRYTPLKCPALWAENQYLVSLRKRKIHAGLNTQTDEDDEPLGQGVPAPPEIDLIDLDGWPTFPETDGMPARIVYEALFTSLKYAVIDQNSFRGAGLKEQDRYVIREQGVTGREQKLPNYGYVNKADPAGTPIPEVGFLPELTTDLVWTWKMVPVDKVPWNAIYECLMKINTSPFGYTRYDQKCEQWVEETYQRGDVKFMGFANGERPQPYDTAIGQRVVDLPFLFQVKTADGLGDGWQKHRVTPGGPWIELAERILVLGVIVPGNPLHQYADLNSLFLPANCGACAQDAALVVDNPPEGGG